MTAVVRFALEGERMFPDAPDGELATWRFGPEFGGQWSMRPKTPRAAARVHEAVRETLARYRAWAGPASAPMSTETLGALRVFCYLDVLALEKPAWVRLDRPATLEYGAALWRAWEIAETRYASIDLAAARVVPALLAGRLRDCIDGILSDPSRLN